MPLRKRPALPGLDAPAILKEARALLARASQTPAAARSWGAR